ncbi:MAG TPA: metallopeptidase TldD-related protein [Bryobacteraceae bacterium]|nr:metallopeptidase TldD-related protein [Bryobacteraceae bacterium]
MKAHTITWVVLGWAFAGLILADTKGKASDTDTQNANNTKQGQRSTASAAMPSPRAAAAPELSSDVIFRAMKDELDRSRSLKIMSLDIPYFIEYGLDDAQGISASAMLGGLLSLNQNRFRSPRVRVRVGDYDFDNTNYIFSDYYSGSRFDPDQFPLDDNYAVLRHGLWLATDRAYKTAAEAIGRKRSALKNVTQSEVLPDFWKAQPVQKILPASRVPLDANKWAAQAKDLSTAFANFPEILTSLVSMDAVQSTHYAYNSEGTAVRYPDDLYYMQARGSGQAPDGMTVRDAIVVQALDLAKLPNSAELKKSVLQVAQNVKALTAAPAGEAYAGPVLFEGSAAAQLFAELLSTNLILPRKAISEPGRPTQFMGSELEGRIGSRILPEFIDVLDDPTQTTWNNETLFGTYAVDDEGVIPQPVSLVEKGKLTNFLLTRQPVKGFNASNGHARMPGTAGARTASISNLFVRASETSSPADLKKRLIDICKQRNKTYAIIVRKMDYPSSASVDEIRRMVSGVGQGGATRPVSMPLLVYRVYPDGREELVRGLRFRGLSVRSLKDIIAASGESYAFHYMNNLAPFALIGAGGYVAPASVIAPSILFDDLELEKPQEDMPKLPLVPPPPLAASR